MKNLVTSALFSLLFLAAVNAQKKGMDPKLNNLNSYEIVKTESRIPGLRLAITHKEPNVTSNDYAILFLHGASFPSALAFGFRMNNYSWMDNLAENGYDVYALDFLGYGNSDRYPEMQAAKNIGSPLGRATEIYKDVDKAVDLILKRTGKKKVYLIAHSWGGSVASLYTTKYPEKVAKLVLFSSITQRQDTTAYSDSASFETMTPEERVKEMVALTPKGETCQLEPQE